MDEFEAWSRQVSTAECLAVLDRNAVPAAAYRTVREAMADPQLAHRDAFAEVQRRRRHVQGAQSAVPHVGLGDRPPGPARAALGEHTREVLGAAGFAAGEVDALDGAVNVQPRGAVGCRPGDDPTQLAISSGCWVCASLDSTYSHSLASATAGQALQGSLAELRPASSRGGRPMRLCQNTGMPTWCAPGTSAAEPATNSVRSGVVPSAVQDGAIGLGARLVEAGALGRRPPP